MIQQNTLGARPKCPRGFTWNPAGNYCMQTSGGGSNRFTNSGIKQLLGARKRCPRGFEWNSNGNYCMQTSGGGVNGLGDNGEQNLIATYMQDLQYAQQQVTYYEAEIQRYPESSEVQSRLAYWKSRVAAIQYLLSRGSTYIRQQGAKSYNTGGDLIEKTRQKLVNAINNITPLNNNSTFSPGNIIDSLQDTLSTNYAGIPLWGIIMLGGAAVYMIAGKKKIKK